ncbi:host attachment protein [Candidatus Sulfurimonas marisnigri]|uniref:Host attachment protein n=1 Tax=Candidatus Sulfurimonas marisnigri TaxID=2740405 RepID=A0A7S7M1T7_9BACT|nr:host attachment protein [Candidatus Sulfurimonas marisnigri]QOY55509.1 host attachment protein [Candidatus Sulfurimonas marisnigri]
MSSKLIIVADLQHFKLFSSNQSPFGMEFVELIEGSESLDIYQRFGKKILDLEENYIEIEASNYGESHKIVLEWEHRRFEEIGKQISKVLKKYSHESWYFAAPLAINNQILDLVDVDEKKKMKINLNSNLTKIENNRLIKHFLK